MSFSLAFSILSPERLCSSKDFKVSKVHKHKFMLFSFATISYHRSKKSVSSKMHYSSSKMSSTKGNISKLSSLLLSSLGQISSLKFRFTFWKASLLLLPGLFSARNRSYVQTRGKQFVVEHVVEGETVSRRLCKDYLHQV